MSGLEQLRQVAEAATPGPWHWFGGDTLATVGRGTQYVLRAFRKGMQGATVRFRRDGFMEEGVDHPDARYLASFSPDVTLALLDVAEQASVTVDAYDAGHEPDAEQDWTEPMVDGPLRAALVRLSEVTS